ncbi:hypothetical protein CC85DRAFT_266204 [Cutaneotrichosporon oleaginosum]|uniref:Small ribosomal subunit protein mS33 n=1 Tax=Cutaneotrichosporon oleaginosum TaxID=879819 RepID=A0A0J0XD59_9TREE|nr:uncharacterized protein CC85DRAFT_266204 [Cutaneotrichosporon oleaginosum]KLT39011.1 hypothetical protein CC85DRAFT_266204 [Cutaneotrichosporon oleaginosum]TXT08317.1 hypothetical protein COLE_05241 [Cutaneotrichosporon oleaginosum]
MPPPSLTGLLTRLRAPIFNTLAPESNARTGTKYLRRRLRGPGMLAYIRKGVSLRTLNAYVPWNKYAGWDRERPDGKAYHLPPSQAVPPGFEEIPRYPKPGTANKPNGWLESGREMERFDDVARRRKMGKGPVKKGEGKRAQMAKTKKKF